MRRADEDRLATVKFGQVCNIVGHRVVDCCQHEGCRKQSASRSCKSDWNCKIILSFNYTTHREQRKGLPFLLLRLFLQSLVDHSFSSPLSASDSDSWPAPSTRFWAVEAQFPSTCLRPKRPTSIGQTTFTKPDLSYRQRRPLASQGPAHALHSIICASWALRIAEKIQSKVISFKLKISSFLKLIYAYFILSLLRRSKIFYITILLCWNRQVVFYFFGFTLTPRSFESY